MKKKLYEAPEMEQIELKWPNLLAGSDGDEEPEQGGTSDNPYSGEGLQNPQRLVPKIMGTGTVSRCRQIIRLFVQADFLCLR